MEDAVRDQSALEAGEHLWFLDLALERLALQRRRLVAEDRPERACHSKLENAILKHVRQRFVDLMRRPVS